MSWLEHTVTERDTMIRDVGKQGEAAYGEGKSIIDCPYRGTDQRADWWRRGFGNARFGKMMAAR